MSQLIECVPNISEGRDPEKIKQVTDVIDAYEGVKLLDVDPGRATNRTVITFVGEPEKVIDAAFLLIKKAAEVIDMSKQTGEHPRMGATDVCPLVPIANISMDELVPYAHKLGERIGKELGIPGYFYELAAKFPERSNLAVCRSGEYEGLDKLSDPKWKPDFGPAKFNASVKKSGATAVGVRDFLVAYNVNLNTTSTRRANSIAFDIREAGRVKREGNPITGKIVNDKDGNPIRIPGKLKAVKGIGWYIEEYGIAQISYNLTNISVTPVHVAFDETCKSANSKGIRVTGSELVGLIPRQAMLDAADYFLTKQQRSLGISEAEKIKIAVKSLGLDDLSPFNPQEKIIEYMLGESGENRLIDMNLTEFANETASESPAPGGGSIAAYIGALGVSLGTMVANLSSHKREWDDKWEEYSEWAVKGQEYQAALMKFVDKDTQAFNKIMEAYGLPKNSDEDKAARKEAIQSATKHAIEVPLAVMQTANASMEVMKAMADSGLSASVSDAGVGALCARSAVIGAYLNVKINTGALEDKTYVEEVLAKADAIRKEAEKAEAGILNIVEEKLS